MKNAIFLLAIMLMFSGMTKAFANTMKIQTQVTCEEKESDQWYSIGVQTGRGNRADLTLVKNNDDDNSKTLAKFTSGTVKKVKNKTIYENNLSTLRLVVSENSRGDLQGELSIIEDGPNSKTIKMDCYMNSTLVFDYIEFTPQPRLGAGN